MGHLNMCLGCALLRAKGIRTLDGLEYGSQSRVATPDSICLNMLTSKKGASSLLTFSCEYCI